MMKSIFLLLFTLIGAQWGFCQESRFFMPTETRRAYEAGTRSYDGKPGDAYWQNTADYTIDVALDPAEKKLTGSETVVYHNNSPDDLGVLVVRLYYDAYKKGNARASSVEPEDVTDGVELGKLTINGQDYDLEGGGGVRRSNTNLFIPLKEPLAAGGKLTMEVDWVQYLPRTNRRTGAYDESTFFVAYWYPQIAVYDDVFGWDELPYNFRTEFYNNLGNYDVKISAPENFSVWATDVLQNAAEVLPDAVFGRWRQAGTAAETVRILTAEDLEGGFRNKSGTWHYKAEEVSDFAFASSDVYLWDATSLKVDGRDVLISTVFPASNADAYTEVTSIQQKTMKHFSEDIPGVPYPYPAFTTFIGLRGGGMEFPMMANNAGPGRGVTIHEMFHTYFPMYVRINEKRFAWMDEGWADYITSLVTERFFENNGEPIFGDFKMQIQGSLGSVSDLPLITSSQFMDDSNYGYASYPLPAFIYSMLHHHLGDEVFLNCLQTYIRRWAKKSPTPYDFFYTFENVSGQDLAWFWEPWFFEYGSPDIAVKSFSNGKLFLENQGNRPVPVKVLITYEEGTTKEITTGASVWKEGGSYDLRVPDAGKVKSLAVNPDVPDNDDLDNYYPDIATVYRDLELPADYLGAYNLIQAPLTVVVSKKNGMLHLSIPQAGVSTYLVPQTDTEFKSLDGLMTVKFNIEEGVTKGMGLNAFGYNLAANKQ